MLKNGEADELPRQIETKNQVSHRAHPFTIHYSSPDPMEPGGADPTSTCWELSASYVSSIKTVCPSHTSLTCHAVDPWVTQFRLPGICHTAQLVKQKFWWPSLSNNIEEYVNSCGICAQSRTSLQLPEGLLLPLPIPRRPWSHISVNFTTDFPDSTAILVVIDCFSKACKLDSNKGAVHSYGAVTPCIQEFWAPWGYCVWLWNAIHLSGKPSALDWGLTLAQVGAIPQSPTIQWVNRMPESRNKEIPLLIL